MNSYNENLHASVVASLQSQELEQKKINAQFNAAMFNLYYAESATVTADDKLEDARTEQDSKAAVKTQAVINDNIVNNLQSSAGQASQYLKQSVTNTSVGAANVQAAASSIVRLAGDMGNVYSMANAADYDSDIFNQTKVVNDLMNDVAYQAELASQMAMEASMLTSEVSASTVLDMAKNTNTLMKGLLKVASSEYDNALQLVTADDATLAATSAKEKLAEGALEDLSIDLTATNDAYEATSKALNLDLKATLVAGEESSAIDVTFDLITSPYVIKSPTEIAQQPTPDIYPVKEYHAILVKNVKKTTFAITNAEALLLNEVEGKVLAVAINQFEPATDQAESTGNTSSTALKPAVVMAKASQRIDTFQISPQGDVLFLCDSDGDEVELGTDYVVFVFARYTEAYKRLLNTFDDYLSAPSTYFTFVNKLNQVDATTIKITDFDKTNAEDVSAAEVEKILDPEYKLTFSGANPDFDTDNSSIVQYRCMFLPFGKKLPTGMLTKNALNALGLKIDTLENVSDEFDTIIAAKELLLNTAKSKLSDLDDEIKDIRSQLDVAKENVPAASDIEATDKQTPLQASFINLNRTMVDQNKKYKQLVDEITKLKAGKVAALKKGIQPGSGKLSFLFNDVIAAQVSADNYTVAVKSLKTPTTSSGKTKGGANKGISTEWNVFIGPSTTDNFGNRLEAGKEDQYIPVILAIPADVEEYGTQFVNALSEVDTVPKASYLTYNPSV